MRHHRQGILDAAGLPAALAVWLVVGGSTVGACPATATEEMMAAGATAAGTLLTVDGKEIVLAGLAFPYAAGAASGSGGESSLAAAIASFANGPVGLAPAGPPDRYGRIRADVHADGDRWLQAELVGAGLAVVRPEGLDAACVRALLARESAARRARAGLWADSNFVAKASDDPSLLAQNGLYGLVEGRVVSVGFGSRMVFLDFGRDFHTDFTVMVPKTLVPRLLEAGIAVETLPGQRVRVRGVIEDSGGPAIRITDPFALEILDREE